jgi:hypothetical protein
MKSERLQDLESRAKGLLNAYEAQQDSIVDGWFSDAIEYIQQLLHRNGREWPFIIFDDEWSWLQKVIPDKPTQNYGGRLLLDRWPLRLIREAEILESGESRLVLSQEGCCTLRGGMGTQRSLRHRNLRSHFCITLSVPFVFSRLPSLQR